MVVVMTMAVAVEVVMVCVISVVKTVAAVTRPL